MNNKHYSIYLTIAIVISLGLTLVTIFFFSESIYSMDTNTYIEPAKSLINNLTFNTSVDSNQAMFLRTPGYPFFISIIYFFTNSDVWIIFIQYIIFLLTSFVIFKIALELVNNKNIAKYAFLISLFDLARIYFVQVLLTETLFTFLITIFILYTIRFLKYFTLRDIITASIILGLATLVRPITIYFIPIFILFITLFILRKKENLNTSPINAIIYLVLPIVLTVGSWNLRNYYLSGVFDICSIKGANGYFYKKGAILSKLNGITFLEQKEKMEEEWGVLVKTNKEFKNMNEMEISKYLEKETISTILEHPFVFLSIQLRGLFTIIIDTGTANYAVLYRAHKEGSGILADMNTMNFYDFIIKLISNHTVLILFSLVGVIYILPLYIFAIYGTYKIILSKEIYNKYIVVFLFLFIGYMVYFSTGVESFSRFRIPLMPLLYILSAYGLYQYFNKKVSI